MQWYENASVGLFLHYGLSTENPHWQEGRSCLFDSIYDLEEECLRRGWHPGKWIDAAKKIRAKYITLACFHCELGYIKAWHSKIPGTKSTRTDFLGMLIEEGKKNDIKILVYITGEAKLKASYKENPWILPQEYAEYVKNPNINIMDMATWQSVYAKEIICELIENYPDVGGFWFDGWNDGKICADVFEMIHSYDRKYLTIKNDFGINPFIHEDRMSLECFGKVCNPDFDFVSACWHEPGDAEFCYVINELSDWWQWRPVPETYDKKSALRMMITIMANGWTAKLGIGPSIGGDFNNALEKLLDDTDHFLSYAQESLMDCKPGGLPQCHYNDGAYGVTTYKPEFDIYYIHLLMPPKTPILKIPDGGILFEKVIDLYHSKEITFKQNDGMLEIIAAFEKEIQRDGDFIIKCFGKKKKRDVFNISEYGEKLPQDICIDLKEQKEISTLILTEDENSPFAQGSWGAPENNRLKDFSLSVSIDGEHFTEVSKGCLAGTRGIKQINFSAVYAKYIRFRALTPVCGGGFIKTLSGLSWTYCPFEKEPENHSRFIQIEGSYIEIDGVKWDTGVDVKQAVIGNDVYIMDPKGTVYMVNEHSANICPITAGQDRIGINQEGRVFAIKDKHSGDLHIRQIAVL